jgi:hypothetical protein
MEFREAEIEAQGRKLHVSFTELTNAVIVLLFEDEPRLGTMALAIPGISEIKATRSSILLGGKYLVASRALAERATALFGKMSLVSLSTSMEEDDAFRMFSELLRKAISTKLRSRTES